MQSIKPELEFLILPGHTTLCLFTDGEFFQKNEDNTGSIGFWNIDPKQPFQRIVVYYSSLVDGRLRGKLYTAFPAGFVGPEYNGGHKGNYSIKLKKLREVGFTETPWEHLFESQNKPFVYIIRARSASVLRISIEYSDGSYDIIKPIQEDPILISSLERNNAGGECNYSKAHTNGAIASLLFMTAITNQRTEYKAYDPRVGTLLRSWKDQEES